VCIRTPSSIVENSGKVLSFVIEQHILDTNEEKQLS
jgi:hypothetical protein